MHRSNTRSMLVYLLILGSSSIFGQSIDTTWTSNFWNGYFDSLNCIQVTSDGGFILTGVTKAEGQTQNDIWLIKTDSLGIQDWAVTIGDTIHSETGFHVLETYDGGYLISAQSDAHGSTLGDGRVWIVRTDADGDTLWTFPMTQIDGNGFPLYAVQTHDSGYAITGIVNESHDNGAFILRLGKDGGYGWIYKYGGESHQDGWFIGETSDGGFIVAGNNDNTQTTGYDFWVLRTNAAGISLWDSSYAITSSTDMLYGACMIDDGLVMVGLAENIGHGLKVDSVGHTVWSKPISKNPFNEHHSAVCPTHDGGLMVGGWTWVTGQRRDFCFTKLDDAGDTLWSYTVGGWQDDHGRSLAVASNDGFVMGGTSYSFVIGTSFYLARIRVLLYGDANHDGLVDDGDLVYLLSYIFRGGPPPDPLEVGDANCDGDINVGDVIYLIYYLYRGGSPPGCD